MTATTSRPARVVRTGGPSRSRPLPPPPLAHRLVATAAVGATVGALGAGWLPRGPRTTTEALVVVTATFLSGLACGRLAGSRWVVLVLPVASAVAFELVRWPVAGPTVDLVHVSSYGILALLSGRGVLAVLGTFPMVVGAAVGALRARSGRPVGAAVAVIAVLALAGVVAVPAGPAPLD
ncbi:MAG: hypothetical protein ACRCSN_00230, partial [Dermatophilaceae bacterium]